MKGVVKAMIDGILLGLIRRGDQNALRQLINKYYAYVCVIIDNATDNRLPGEDVEETASDVFLALWVSAEKVQKVKPWLGATSKNKALKKTRKLCENLSLDNDIIVADGCDLEEKTISDEERNAVKSAILSMDSPDREIFIGHYYNSQTTAAISRKTGMSESAVKQRLVRGREKLRLILEQEGFAE